MFNVLYNVVTYGTLALALFFSAKWGGREEKLTAYAFSLAAIGSRVSNTNKYANVETGILAIDTLLLLALVAIAMRSDRFWPLWAAGFQMVAVCVHIAGFAKTDNSDWAYAIAVNFWSFPVIFALLCGIALESRKRQLAS